ncbi:MAG: hypothetical protein LBG44_01705 [Gemmatimonadota bacterium]|jgi:hypothetical protein|nr:hypothetical protein [Gemmatimonadota bacterium]
MRPLFLLPLALMFSATTAFAQNGLRSPSTGGFELRGSVHFNRSEITPEDSDWRARNSYGVGLQYLLLGRATIGLYAHSDGRSGPTVSDTTAWYLSTEANYLLPLELGMPGAALYVGAHANLGAFDRGWLSNPSLPDLPNSTNSLGYQIGFRLKPVSIIGLEAQWRHQSRDVWEAQEGFLQRDQFLLGVLLF